MGKEFFGVGLYMPFSREVRLVPQLLHPWSPHILQLRRIDRAVLSAQHPQLAIFLEGSPERAARIEHGSRGDADRSRPGPHVIAVGKLHSVTGQLIQVRCLNQWIIMRPQRVIRLVIRKDKENIGFRSLTK